MPYPHPLGFEATNVCVPVLQAFESQSTHPCSWTNLVLAPLVVRSSERLLFTAAVAIIEVKLVNKKTMGARIIGTMLVGAFWFAFIVIYLAFFASGFDFWQKLAIFLATGAIAAALIGVFWVKWALG